MDPANQADEHFRKKMALMDFVSAEDYIHQFHEFVKDKIYRCESVETPVRAVSARDSPSRHAFKCLNRNIHGH
jgi:hypothetical protein